MHEQRKFIISTLIGLIVLVIIFHIAHYVYMNWEFQKVSLIKWDVIPLSEQPELLNKRLNEVAVNSSHNTYLDSTQHVNFTSFNTLKKCLTRYHVRSIELDIGHAFINNEDIPTVYHGYKTFRSTSPRPLREALEIIKKYGLNTSDPLFIFTDVYDRDNTTINQKINDLFIEYFGDKLYNANSAEPPYLRDIVGKVLIYGPPVCNVFQPQYQEIISHKYAETHQPEKNKIYRVYHKGSIKSYLSCNFNYEHLIAKGYQMIAMNNQTNDKLLYNYYNKFRKSSFLLLE